ncbi:MAG TPA: hypothetical protein VI997_04905, partial [Candidatus Thermoplasmatota archaeon]|nr:hypothetical protein [Candidatus Thermoplasmatota archaeon]
MARYVAMTAIVIVVAWLVVLSRTGTCYLVDMRETVCESGWDFGTDRVVAIMVLLLALAGLVVRWPTLPVWPGRSD